MNLRVFASLFFAGLLATTSLFPVQAQADIVFDLSNASPDLADGLNNGDTVSANGVTMTFSNVVIANGAGAGEVEPTGILMSATTDDFNDVIQFDFESSHDILITQYTIGQHEDMDTGRFFNIAGPGGLSGDNTLPDGTSGSSTSFIFDAGTISFFESGQVYTFTHNLTAVQDSTFNLGSFTATAVPEPGTATLALFGVTGLALRRRR